MRIGFTSVSPCRTSSTTAVLPLQKVLNANVLVLDPLRRIVSTAHANHKASDVDLTLLWQLSREYELVIKSPSLTPLRFKPIDFILQIKCRHQFDHFIFQIKCDCVNSIHFLGVELKMDLSLPDKEFFALHLTRRINHSQKSSAHIAYREPEYLNCVLKRLLKLVIG